ncbi:MAG: hypothetical protein ACXWCR_06860 [Flavitalea sp.]
MKKIFIFILSLPLLTSAQKNPEISLAFTNNHTAYPFASFSKLFTGPYHPGVEVGYRFNWKTKSYHDWYQAVNVGYIYHRFLQHAITLYTQTGYRYKLQDRWRFSGALGLGYLHSVPATAVLELNENGGYEKDKGIGRAQVMFQFSVGTQYQFKIHDKPASVFLDYRQTIQAPFVKSYIPLLPYNSIAIGGTISLPKKSRL